MNYQTHPHSEQLIDYLKAPESADHQATGLHLASCSQCRAEFDAISILRENAPQISHEWKDTTGQISDLLQNRLSPQQASQLRDQIKQDPELLREALHFASHDAAMRRAVDAPEPAKTGDFFWQSCKQKLSGWLQFETPAWKMIPVAALLVAVVFTFNSQQSAKPANQLASIINFDDRPTIQFIAQDRQPGIGFFASAQQSALPFEGVSIQFINDNKLTFSWPAIDDAVSYQLKLQVFRDGETVVLGRISSKLPTAVFELDQPLTQHRHEWVLTGDTFDKRSFQTSGGFVVHQTI